jgi:hypothetical protein
MDTNQFVLESWHIGHKTIRVCGRRVRLPFRVKAEDVGRHICFTVDGTLHLSDIEVTFERFPCMHAICRATNLRPMQHIVHRRYAIGDPEKEYEMTPWFTTITGLEQYCRRFIGAYLPQRGAVQ